MGIIAAADIVVSSDDATFAFTEARLGLAPVAISPLCWRRWIVARQHAAS